LRETVFWSPTGLEPPNDSDEINSSAAYGFVFDFCGVEIDRDTGRCASTNMSACTMPAGS
jgi:2-furoyl-CoA dehydrogenase large subunit